MIENFRDAAGVFFYGYFRRVRYMLFLKQDIRKLLGVMLPILVAQISTGGVTFINTTMAGHAGADDLAGVSVGAGLFYPLLASIVGLLMAGTPIMAQLLGEKKKEELPYVARAGLAVGGVLSLLFAAAYFLLIDDLTEFMTLEGSVAHIARYYLLCMVGVVFFVSAVIPLRCVTDTAGSTSISMKLFLAAPVINGVLNYLFIYGNFGMPALGGIGAGVSMMVTYGIILGLFLLVLVKSKTLPGKEIFSSLQLRGKDIREYLTVGVPSGLSVFMEMFLFSLIIVFLARYGTETLAAYQIADNFATMVFMVPVSCSMALTILVASSVGAGDLELGKRYKRAGFVVALIGASITASVTVIGRDFIGNIYTNDAAVAAIAANFLIYCAGWQLFDAVSTPIQGILRGLKDTRVSFFLMVAAYWGCSFPMSLFLDYGLDLGAESYWLGLIFGVACSAGLMVLRLCYVERVMAGRPVLTWKSILRFIRDGKLCPEIVPFAVLEAQNRALLANTQKARALIRAFAETEEKLSVLIQNIKQAEVDIYRETRTVLPIRLALLTDLHLSILGHATRAYVP